MNVFSAIGFMALGGLIVKVFDWQAWAAYNRGRREGNKR